MGRWARKMHKAHPLQVEKNTSRDGKNKTGHKRRNRAAGIDAQGGKMTATEIKQLRQAFGLSQERFAHLLGVSGYTVQRWEAARYQPSPLAVEKLKDLKRKAPKQAQPMPQGSAIVRDLSHG